MLRMALTAFLIAASVSATAADAPTARLKAHVMASEATSGKTLYLQAAGGGLTEGAHHVRFVVFDSDGKEIMAFVTEINANHSGKWRQGFKRPFRTIDVPGTWWVTLEVDGKPAASSSFEVTGAK